MSYALEIKNLSKSYDGGATQVLDNVSFSVAEGEFFGFLGPNGAGKTTTIECITGISTFTQGSVSLFGIDVVSEYRAARMKAGFSPQEFHIDIFAKVHSILDYMGGFYGMRKRERMKRIDELLALFKLEAYRNEEFRKLSGGYKRRVALARAMMHDPELLILDEPTAGVDVELRHELWGYFRELNKKGKTIFLTSHYLEEVELLCGTIAIINKGKIVAHGAQKDFVKDGKKLEDTYLKITKGEAW